MILVILVEKIKICQIYQKTKKPKNLSKSKNSKMSDLAKVKNLDFAKINLFGANLLISKTKKISIYL